MIIIPAIDLKDGKCVRLRRGEEGTETIFHENPIEIAKYWEKQGAKRLHVIDLDGAFLKHPIHYEIIKKIAKAVSIPVQVGGGIRSKEDIKAYLDAGISWVIIGTLALEDEENFKKICQEFTGHILLAIDVKDGKVAIEGWKKVTKESPLDLAKKAQELGIAGINYTDILRDGMETGVNLEGLKSFLKELDIPVYVAGGISSIEDIKRLLYLQKKGLAGIIVGRALYTGKINLKEAIKLIEG